MKIVFLCGSLEPGKDGVGDYTRRLGIEMIRKGHQVNFIALNDEHINEVNKYNEEIDDFCLTVFRVPASLPLKWKINVINEWISHFNPEWISLQFVIFSFHPKGLPFRLNSFIGSIGKERRWHIMFHELWVGISLNASKKYIIWGWFQRKIITSLIRKLNPEIIQTQSRLYYTQLQNLGYDVSILPLFSNIPLSKKNAKTENVPDKSNIELVVFGTIHPDAPLKTFVDDVILYKQKHKVEFTITFIGRCGKQLDYWVDIWRSANFTVNILGDQPVEYISQILKNATIGVSTNSIPIIDKSGTVAAMLAHRLPVISVAKHFEHHEKAAISLPFGIFPSKPGCIDNCLSMNKKEKNFFTVKEISQELLDRLAGHKL
jgi:hypothetical protein